MNCLKVEQDVSTVDHWDLHARSWQYFGSPLRPCRDDVRWVEQKLAQLDDAEHALLLGVTPEYATMAWPSGCRLLAVDRNRSMIDWVWPSNEVDEACQVVCGDWWHLPVGDASTSVVLGDGVTFAGEADLLESEIHRVLKRDGRFFLRAFVRPPESESLEGVHEALFARKIGSFHAYKWRLAMASCDESSGNVCASDIWSAWDTWVSDPEWLTDELGWAVETVSTIESYRNSIAVYDFPRLDALRERLEIRFNIVSEYVPDYELGERCPLFELSPA